MATKTRFSCYLIMALACVIFRVEHSQSQTRPRRPKSKPIAVATPSPSPTPDVQTIDGITRVYDESNNVTLLASGELVLYDDASKGAVNPLRVTMNLVTTYSGRLPTASPTTDPLVRILFRYRYFVPKFDVGDSRDFAIFTGLSTLEASGHLTFISRENSGRDVITTMQAGIRASEFDKILQALKAARSVSLLLGRDSFALRADQLELIEKFLATTPHPKPDMIAAQSTAMKCDLTVAQSPALRGFRLGESLDDVIRRFPGAQSNQISRTVTTESKVEHSSVDITFGTYLAFTPQRPASSTNLTEGWTEVLADSRFFPAYQGVAKLRFEFIDRQVIAIRAEYKDEIKWQNLDEFVAASASGLGLSDQWKVGPLLTCNGFTIKADSSIHSSLELRDTAAQLAARQREEELRKKQDDKRKSTFKP